MTGGSGQFTGRRVEVGSCLGWKLQDSMVVCTRVSIWEKPLHWVLQKRATSHVCPGD